MFSLLKMEAVLNNMFLVLSRGQMTFGDFEVLFEMAKNKEVIVELGTARGLGAIVLSIGGGQVFTIDNYRQKDFGNPPMGELSRDESKAVGDIIAQYLHTFWGKIETIRSDTDNADFLFSNNSIDLLYIDADHHYEGVKKDFELWLPRVKKEGHIMFHDYSDVHKPVKEFIDKEVLIDSRVKEIKMETLCPTVIKIVQKL